MQNLLSALAPSSAANRTWQDADAQNLIAQKSKKLLGDELRSLVVQSVVKHRKMQRKVTTVTRSVYKTPTPADPETKKRYETSLHLKLIEESDAGTMAGTNGWQLNHFVALREWAVTFKATGKLPECLLLSKPLPENFLTMSGKASVGMLVAGGHSPVILPGRSLPQKEFRRVLASFKPVWKRLYVGLPEPEATVVLVLRTFSRCVEGTVDLPDVLI
ncbi:hypothetical protein HDV00_010382 [Rhizophlyctis rosea]|nr:hypothetical protein HDV00_010382 [Rhizophlyctis rosea]